MGCPGSKGGRRGAVLRDLTLFSFEMVRGQRQGKGSKWGCSQVWVRWKERVFDYHCGGCCLFHYDYDYDDGRGHGRGRHLRYSLES